MKDISYQKKNDDLITVFIADDHAVFRQCLKSLIADDQRYLIVGEADEGRLAWNRISELKPRIALLDINMPNGDGLDVAAQIQESDLETKTIIVTSYKDEGLVKRAKEIGGLAYVLKDDYLTDLPAALQSVTRGEEFLSPAIRSALQKRSYRSDASGREAPNLDKLTPTQLRILRLFADECNSAQVAKQLAMTSKSVEAHRSIICESLQLESSIELLSFAREHLHELRGFKLIPKDLV